MAVRRSKRPPATGRAVAEANGRPAAAHLLQPDLRGALELVLEMMAIPGRSGQEGAVQKFVTDHLRSAGIPEGAIRTDQAHRRSVLPGEVGNLVVRLPGTASAPRRMLMAHLDTVPICIGSRPKVQGNWISSADPNTGLGGDDRAGAAVLLATALAIARHGLPHPPLTFLWTVQEEAGLHGAHHVQTALLGKPRLAFNWDGGPAEKLTIGATGGYRMLIDVHGIASHAGGAPERGVSAIAIASLAIADLVRGGWHGEVLRGRRRGTSNVGVVEGGQATNVVTPHVQLKAEARSHDPKFRANIIKAYERAFRRAAAEVRSAAGKRGHVDIEGRLDYESFRLADDDASLLAAEAAIRQAGGQPVRAVSNGGLDANWMTAHGIPTVTLGCGQVDIHTTSEKLDISAFQTACRVALALATATP